MSTAATCPNPGAIAAATAVGREGVPDVGVGPRLGEDDPADRAVGEDERPAAVAAFDGRAELQDLAADLVLAVDVVAGRRIPPGDGGGEDHQLPAVREAERRPDGAADRVRGGERERPETETR